MGLHHGHDGLSAEVLAETSTNTASCGQGVACCCGSTFCARIGASPQLLQRSGGHCSTQPWSGRLAAWVLGNNGVFGQLYSALERQSCCLGWVCSGGLGLQYSPGQVPLGTAILSAGAAVLCLARPLWRPCAGCLGSSTQPWNGSRVAWVLGLQWWSWLQSLLVQVPLGAALLSPGAAVLGKKSFRRPCAVLRRGRLTWSSTVQAAARAPERPLEKKPGGS